MVSGRRDYKAEYRRRQRRARARGFTGYAQQRRFSPRIRSSTDLGRLPERARDARTDALRVVAAARDRGISIEQAARDEQVQVDAVTWWAGSAVGPKRGGRTLPKRGDRLLRLRPIILDGDDRVEFVAIWGSNAAADAQRIFDVQYRFIAGQASELELQAIAARKVAGRFVESDPERLEAIGEAGGVDVLEAYRAVLG